MVSVNERDKNWLLSHFKLKSYKKVMRGDVIHDYLYAEKILKGADKIHRRGCGCEYGSVARAVDKLYEQWLKQDTT